MTGASVERMPTRRRQHRHREKNSSSPLSVWTSVVSEPVKEPNRTVFTILADDTGELSPRPPKPELAELESKGMVNLSSPGSDKRPTLGNSSHLHDSPINKATLCDRIDDDDIIKESFVIVTDKVTQTDQPWPFLEQNDCKETENEKFNIPTNTSHPDNSLNNATSSGTNTFQQNQQNNNGNVSSSENEENQAPTLKVEYVGKVWDAYINDFLLASDDICEAAIYDKATKSCISCSSQFVMSNEEFDCVLKTVNSVNLAYKYGFTVNNIPHKTILSDGRRGLMAKAKDNGGCSVCQTRTLVLIAMHDRRGRSRRCNDELMRLGDFFWAKGL